MQSFERFYFTGSNSRLSAIDFGNPSLPDLVMVHGMRDHGLSLYSLAAALKHDYHVIAVDLCGHGRSENPGNYTMTQFVADLRALVLDRKLIKPVLVGHSLGGHIVSRYSAVFAADVPNLVLLDGIGPPGMGLAPGPEDIRQDLKAGIALVLEKPNNGRQMADEAEAVSRLSKNNPKLDLAAAQIIAQHGTEAHPDGGVRWSWDPAVRMVWQSFSKAEAEDLWQFNYLPCAYSHRRSFARLLGLSQA